MDKKKRRKIVIVMGAGIGALTKTQVASRLNIDPERIELLTYDEGSTIPNLKELTDFPELFTPTYENRLDFEYFEEIQIKAEEQKIIVRKSNCKAANVKRLKHKQQRNSSKNFRHQNRGRK